MSSSTLKISETIESDVVIFPATNKKEEASNSTGLYYYIESYGCQMNLSDSEIVASVLNSAGYKSTENDKEADVIFLNTCSIREKAETRIRNRLKQFNDIKKKKKGLIIGVLGCMAERLKSKLLEEERLVDLVAGPDVYRDLPNMIQDVSGGQKSVNILLSREETYADISPVRYSSNGVSGYISIMRGCDNMCAFCVVPYTRGRERSRPADSILAEAKQMVAEGFKEVTLLGQNVDSYRWSSDPKLIGLKLIENKFAEHVVNFSRLLEMVALECPSMRIRFSTSHPKDMSDDVFEVMKRNENICKSIHLPVQSGSSSCLDRMSRSYTREWYINRVDTIRTYMPECTITSDFITGFCGETEEEHQETLTLMKYVNYDASFMYYYSERPGTLAAKKYQDDISEEIKKRRLQEIIDLQNELALARNKAQIGTQQKVLLEYTARKSKEQLVGRTDGNKKTVVSKEDYSIGDTVLVEITDCSSASLFGKIIKKIN